MGDRDGDDNVGLLVCCEASMVILVVLDDSVVAGVRTSEREKDGIEDRERMKMMVKEGEGVSGFCFMRAREEREGEMRGGV